jgi:hypothetical protein
MRVAVFILAMHAHAWVKRADAPDEETCGE